MGSPTNPEILLISATVQTGDLAEAIENGITPECFHSHRPEWEWIEGFARRYRKPPDKATFRSSWPDFPLLRTTDTEHAAEEVLQSHLRHELARNTKAITNALVSDDPQQALALMHQAVSGLDHQTGGRDAHADVLRSFDPVFAEAKRRVEASDRLGYAGVSLAFPTLNDYTGGMHPGDLAIWAARLNQGKTWALVKVAVESVLAGKRVCFVSLEQPRSQIVFRLHTLLAREMGYSIRHRDLMQGTNLDLDYYRSFLMDLPQQVAGSMFVSDPSRGKVGPFTLASLMERHSPDLLVLDYLTLMDRSGEDWRATAKLSADTALVAKQYGTPILAAAQINREGDGGNYPPRTRNLAEADAIGQDADLVITHRQASRSTWQCLLDKNRSGQRGQIFWAAFQPNEGRIAEISHEQAATLKSQDMIEDDT